MKVKKIKIAGMHKIDSKSYNLNDNISYFIGENGAGKSTVLEAIQLALLGYIPGYAKTNESIIKHSSGNILSVEADFDNGLKVTRNWLKSGSSVKSTTSEDGKTIDELMKDVPLPVVDFNEFRSMTANKLKDWFITFLPSANSDLDIEGELRSALGDRVLRVDDLIADVNAWLASNSNLSGLELVRKLNEKFKEDQSYTKGQVAKLQGTIQSLVRYDDAEDIDVTTVQAKIADLNDLKTRLIEFQTNDSMIQRVQSSIDVIKAQLPAARYEDDPRIAPLNKKIDDLNKKSEVIMADYADISEQLNELLRQKSMLPKGGSSCPYTNEPCPSATALAIRYKEECEKLDKQIAFKREELAECDPSLKTANDKEILKLQAEIYGIRSQYDQLISLQLQLDNIEVKEIPTSMNLLQIDSQIRELQDNLIKAEANKKYEQFADQVTADKFKLENDLEIYKVWIKKTDANGLQTELMNKPFESLAERMSSYLSKMFNKPTTAKFNLSSKANSFGFGIERDDNYIEFDYLSSGERCLFTLALILCALDNSNSEVRIVLIDDILDHLDSSNANYLFDALKNIDNVQFILAGVKECTDSSICIQV